MKTDNSKQNFSIRLFFIALIWALVLFVIAVLFYKDSILYSIISFAAKTNNQFVYERIIWHPDLFEKPCLEAIKKEQYPQEISRFICNMQPPNIDTVRTLVDNNNAEVREQAIKTLGESGDKSSISIIIKSLSDKNEEVAASAMFALAHLKATDAFNTLKEIFEDKHKSFYMRSNALTAIVKIDKNKSLPYVKNGINDANEEIRYVSVNCLEKYDSDVIFSCLVTVLHDKSVDVRKEALNITSIKYLPEYKTYLISCLSDKDTEVRISAMNILSRNNTEDTEIYKLLIKQLNSFDSKDIETALFCLKKYFTQKPLEQIYSLAGSTQDALVKYRILEYLEEKGEFDSVPHIRKFTSDGDEDVRKKAEDTIQKLMSSKPRN